MNDSVNPKPKDKIEINKEHTSQFSKGGLYVREDDQDWGSSGMNDIKSQSEIS
tara:strand:- start:103 stop:261 length:159 start_codon:yes stop_codon:yes gene_type:complete